MMAEMARSQRTELLERINSFPYWHYSFDLGDGVIINPKDATNSRGTRDFIWPAVLTLCGREDLKGLRVLDVACNAGFWSLQATNSGAEYVLGIDARPMHIEQAELVRDVLGIDPGRLAYRTMNIYDLSAETVGTFDVCLVFRIIHHLRHPLLALDRLREVCRGFLVVDVRVLRQAGCVLQLHGEDEGTSSMASTGWLLNPARRPSSGCWCPVASLISGSYHQTVMITAHMRKEGVHCSLHGYARRISDVTTVRPSARVAIRAAPYCYPRLGAVLHSSMAAGRMTSAEPRPRRSCRSHAQQALAGRDLNLTISNTAPGAPTLAMITKLRRVRRSSRNCSSRLFARSFRDGLGPPVCPD